MTIETVKDRLRNYPGAHPGEEWKNNKNLGDCTAREKAQMHREGTSVEELTRYGLNRGEVHHVLYGWRFSAQ